MAVPTLMYGSEPWNQPKRKITCILSRDEIYKIFPRLMISKINKKWRDYIDRIVGTAPPKIMNY